MATQNEILQMKDELRKIQEQMHKSRRRAAIGFGLLVFALVLSFVYAFVQQVAAERNAEEALRQEILAKESMHMAEANAKEAVRQEGIVKEMTRMLDECRSMKK